MIYMLDTNICSFIIKNNPKSVIAKLKSIPETDRIVLSSIVVSELMYGISKKNSDKLARIVNEFVDFFEILDFDKKAAIKYGKIRSYLEKKGVIIGAYDLQIAAHAKSVGAVLVTNNTKEFSRIEGLVFEDWT